MAFYQEGSDLVISQEGSDLVISQSTAAEAFEKGERMGKGGFGEVRLGEIYAQKVVIKKFNDKDNALLEYYAHMAFFSNLSDDCQAFFSKPLKMKFESVQDQLYLCQQPLYRIDEEEVGSWTSLLTFVRKKGKDAAKHILVSLQKIIQCLADGVVSHEDLTNPANTLIVLKKKDEIESVKFRVIDFGVVKLSEDDDDRLDRFWTIYKKIFKDKVVRLDITHSLRNAFLEANEDMRPSLEEAEKNAQNEEEKLKNTVAEKEAAALATYNRLIEEQHNEVDLYNYNREVEDLKALQETLKRASDKVYRVAMEKHHILNFV